MSERTQTLIERYIERLAAQHEQSGNRLGLEDLRRIALELELGEADLAAADQEAVHHLHQGLVCCQYQQWDEAIRHLGIAVLLDPLHVDGLHGLARAYQGRWSTTRTEADRLEADRLGRRCLTIEPCHEAVKALVAEVSRQKPWSWRRLFRH